MKWTEAKQTAEDSEGGTTTVEVIGDVKSDVNGIVMDLENEKIKTSVLVDGTVSAEEHSIVLLNEQGIDNMTLTVWKVEANEDGSLIETYDEDADTYTLQMSSTFLHDLVRSS